jgi:hypothetical protein
VILCSHTGQYTESLIGLGRCQQRFSPDAGFLAQLGILCHIITNLLPEIFRAYGLICHGVCLPDYGMFSFYALEYWLIINAVFLSNNLLF